MLLVVGSGVQTMCFFVKAFVLFKSFPIWIWILDCGIRLVNYYYNIILNICINLKASLTLFSLKSPLLWSLIRLSSFFDCKPIFLDSAMHIWRFSENLSRYLYTLSLKSFKKMINIKTKRFVRNYLDYVKVLNVKIE